MSDSVADVIAEALTHHRHDIRWGGMVCTCGARDLANGDRWETHLADITVAALTQAGHLNPHPTPARDYTAEAHWRAAALAVVATWTAQPVAGVDAAAVQRDFLRHTWPSLAAAVDRLARAKAELLKEHP